MKYFNLIGGILAVVLIIAGQHGYTLPVTLDIPIPHVLEEKPLIDGEGLHVLIVADKLNLPRAQETAIACDELRGWVSDHHALFHVWAPNQDTTSEAPEWQAAMKLPRESDPWLIVSMKGKPNFNGPLPADTKSLMDVLRKYE